MRIAALAFALAATSAAAAPEEYRVDPGHTYPAFAVSHMGISTQRGRFEKTTGRVVLDREASRGTIDLVIDATTISTGNRMLDAVLRSEDFFNSAAFPTLTYRGTSIDFEAGLPRRAHGELTLLGVTKPVTVSISRFGCTRQPFMVRLTCGADVSAIIKRTDFGMNSYMAWVGDEVILTIQIEAVKVDAPAEPALPGS